MSNDRDRLDDYCSQCGGINGYHDPSKHDTGGSWHLASGGKGTLFFLAEMIGVMLMVACPPLGAAFIVLAAYILKV